MESAGLGGGKKAEGRQGVSSEICYQGTLDYFEGFGSVVLCVP